MPRKFSVAVGDKVAYSVQFLRSIGMSHSSMARARGVVKSIETLGGGLELAVIDWSDDSPERVNVQNLAKVGANLRFAQC